MSHVGFPDRETKPFPSGLRSLLLKPKFVVFEFREPWIGGARVGSMPIRVTSTALVRNYEAGYVLRKRNIVILRANGGLRKSNNGTR